MDLDQIKTFKFYLLSNIVVGQKSKYTFGAFRLSFKFVQEYNLGINYF